MNLVYVYVKYGLDNPGIHIYSIECFDNLPFNLTLLGSYELVLLSWILGSLYVIFLIACVSQFVRSRFYTVLAVSAFVFVPYFLVGKKMLIKFLFPITFFTDGGFFTGMDIQQERKLVLSQGQAGAMMVIYAAVMAVLLLVTLHKSEKQLTK